MTFDDVVKLANAGFNRKEIYEMMKLTQAQAPMYQQSPALAQAPMYQQSPAQAQTPMYQQSPAQAQAPMYQQSPAQAQAPMYQQSPAQANGLEGKIDNLISTLQANAVAGTSMPEPESVDDILAGFINPPHATDNTGR